MPRQTPCSARGNGDEALIQIQEQAQQQMLALQLQMKHSSRSQQQPVQRPVFG